MENSAADGRPRNRTGMSPDQQLEEFRTMSDAFWNDPSTQEARQRTPQNKTDVAGDDILQSLRLQGERTGVMLKNQNDLAPFTLRRSWVIRRGQIVDLAGVEGPLPPNKDLLVVTSTMSCTSADISTTDTQVLVYGRTTP
jgi:hypothetical protein